MTIDFDNSIATGEERQIRTGSKSCIEHHVNCWFIENYLRLPALHVDFTVSCRGASQSPVYRPAFRPTPLSSSTQCHLRREKTKHSVGENVDSIWHEFSLPPRQILRRRSFPSDSSPRTRAYICMQFPLV